MATGLLNQSWNASLDVENSLREEVFMMIASPALANSLGDIKTVVMREQNVWPMHLHAITLKCHLWWKYLRSKILNTFRRSVY
jgi:hypothetical protein